VLLKQLQPYLSAQNLSVQQTSSPPAAGPTHTKSSGGHISTLIKNVNVSGNYVEDLRQGTWYHYEENGNIKETEVFKDGVSENLNIQKFEKLDVNEEESLNTPPVR